MRISNTGFFTSKYNNNIDTKSTYQSQKYQTDIFIHQKKQPQSFKGGFFNIDKIKELFDTKRTKKLQPNETIDIETAKKIIKKELNKNKTQYEEKTIDKYLEDITDITPNKTKVIVDLYTLFKKEPHSDYINKPLLPKYVSLFFKEDNTLNNEIYQKFKSNINYIQRYSYLVAYLNLLECTKDSEGYHPEVLDLIKTSYAPYIEIQDIKKKNKVNLELVNLLKYFDNINGSPSYDLIIGCGWKNDKEPDLNTIDNIIKNKNKIKDIECSFEHKEKIKNDNLLYYIWNGKNKNDGSYNLEYNKYLDMLINIPNANLWFCVLDKIVDTCMYKNKISDKAINQEKLEIIINTIKKLDTPTRHQLSAAENFIELINGNKKRAVNYLKLYDSLHIDTNKFYIANSVFKHCIDKENNIDNKFFPILKELTRIIKSEKEIINFIETIKTPKNKVNEEISNAIFKNAEKTDYELYPVIELAKTYFDKVNPKYASTKDLDTIISAYVNTVDCDFKNYIKQEYYEKDKVPPDTIDIDYSYENFIENYKYILNYSIKNTGLDHNKFNKVNQITQIFGCKNSYETVKIAERIAQKEINKLVELFELAKQNKQTLRDGTENLTDETLKEEFTENYENIIDAQNLLGTNLLKHCFNLKLDGFIDFVDKIQNLQGEWNEQIKIKIFPEQTETYIKEQNNIKQLKQKLKERITPEQKILENKNKKHIELLQQEISELKKSLINKSDATKIKEEITSKTRKIKKLNTEIQQYYKAEKFQNIINKINNSQNIINKLESEKITDPNEIIKHLKALSVIYEFFSKFDFDFYINNMTKKDIQSKKNLAEFINEKVFGKLGIEYDKKVKKYIDFSKSKYLSNLLEENSYDFDTGLKIIYRQLKSNMNKSPDEIFDNMHHNLVTQKIYKGLGIDYKKWTTVDKNSFINVEISTDIENAKQGIIKSIEEDFNSTYWNKIPQVETQKIIDAINRAGFELKPKNIILYDDDGYAVGEKNWNVLLKDGQPIDFEDMQSLISAIKEVMNNENYWNTDFVSEEDDDNDSLKEEEIAKDTLLTHILKMRDKELSTIKNMKKNEETNIEVRKTDMNDIAHSLFLGNHASCCTAIGDGCNSWSAPYYIINKCISSIEIVDGKQSIGNTMCYIAKVDDEPALILDNIELVPQYQYNDKIRDAIFKYAKKLCNEIGKPNMKIYAGPNRHKVNMDNYEIETKTVIPQGLTEHSVYIDAITDDFVINSKNSFTERLYKIR